MTIEGLTTHIRVVDVYVVSRRGTPAKAYIENRAAATREVRRGREVTGEYFTMTKVKGYIKETQDGKSNNIPRTKRVEGNPITGLLVGVERTDNKM